jgi:UDP-N-acetylmuramate: L-alanyl-gamma-D-glutamyl-meso-diaminopimelate ligase
LSFCLQGPYGWEAREVLLPLAASSWVAHNVEELVQQVVHQARPGDHVLCMSNGGFGGVHDKLLAALKQRHGQS